MLYKVVQSFESVNEILSVAIQIKTIEKYFPVMLLSYIQYKVVPGYF